MSRALYFCVVPLALLAVTRSHSGADDTDLRRVFERHYHTWRTSRSLSSHLPDKPGFTEIVSLGPGAVPFIVEKLEENPDDLLLGKMVQWIAKKRFEASDWPTWDVYEGTRGAAWLCVRWWREGRMETPRRFEALYDEWKSFEKQGQTHGAAAKLKSIVWLGIDALPLIMEKVKAGDAELLPAVNQLTDNALGDQPTIASALAWWEANKEKWTLPPSEPLAPLSQPATKAARQDFDQMLEEAKTAWSRRDFAGAEQLAQEVLKHPQATEEHKRRAQLILDRVAESRSGAGTSQPGTSASQPAAPPTTQASSAPTGQPP
jgi:hypothetical protein